LTLGAGDFSFPLAQIASFPPFRIAGGQVKIALDDEPGAFATGADNFIFSQAEGTGCRILSFNHTGFQEDLYI
jgi:hypothetical protein